MHHTADCVAINCDRQKPIAKLAFDVEVLCWRQEDIIRRHWRQKDKEVSKGTKRDETTFEGRDKIKFRRSFVSLKKLHNFLHDDASMQRKPCHRFCFKIVFQNDKRSKHYHKNHVLNCCQILYTNTSKPTL